MSPHDLASKLHDRLVFRWKTVGLAHIVGFVDIDQKRNGSKHRKK